MRLVFVLSAFLLIHCMHYAMDQLPDELILHIVFFMPSERYAYLSSAVSIGKRLACTSKRFALLLAGRLKKYTEQLDNNNRYITDELTPLLLAIIDRKNDMIIDLIAHGADIYKPTRSGWNNPMFTAISHDNYDALLLLLEEGADPNSKPPKAESNPLCWAIVCKRKNMVELLLKSGADPNLPANRYGTFPRDLAKRDEDDELVRLLQAYGALTL